MVIYPSARLAGATRPLREEETRGPKINLAFVGLEERESILRVL